MLEHYKSDLLVAGVDESGAGSVSGSVFASSVILPKDYYNKDLNDSKKMSKKKREVVYEDIINNAISYNIKSVSCTEIDEINILQARFKAMDLALKNMRVKPEYVIIDGNKYYDEYDIPYETIVKGDGIYYSIAAASVLAKVTKDKEMLELHEKYSMYGWNTNSGYGTAKHIQAIRDHGYTEYHRKSFKIKSL